MRLPSDCAFVVAIGGFFLAAQALFVVAIAEWDVPMAVASACIAIGWDLAVVWSILRARKEGGE